MTFAIMTILALISGLTFLAIAAQRRSATFAWIGIGLIALVYAPQIHSLLSRLPTFSELVSTSHAKSGQKLSEVFKEVEGMVKKGRTTPAKMPTLVSVERFSQPGVYDDVILVYGYPDNYAAAREITEYASRKYKRDYRFTPVQ